VKTAVVTGASGGIGRATALALAARGYRVFNFSRTDGGHSDIEHIKTDVCAESEVAASFACVLEKCGHINVVVNNAGFGISGAIEFTDAQDARRMFDVDFFGALTVMQQASGIMRRQGYGTIINISSVAAVFSIPFQGFYSAAKAGINSLTLALKNELAPFGVNVCAIMPGDVKTGFTGARKKSLSGSEVYGKRMERAVAAMEKDEQNGMPPQKVARLAAKLADKKRVAPLYTVGAKYKAFVALSRLLPTSLANFVVGKMYG